MIRFDQVLWNGSEIIFTLFRSERATDEEFARDEQWIRTDLEKLKGLLESKL